MHLVKWVHTLDTVFQSFRKHVYKTGIKLSWKSPGLACTEPWAQLECCVHQVRWSMPVISALRRRRQENQRSKLILGYVAEFKVSPLSTRTCDFEGVDRKEETCTVRPGGLVNPHQREWV